MTGLICGWCNKSQAEVKTLITGLKVCICNECVILSSAQMATNSSRDHSVSKRQCSFCQTFEKTLDKPLAFGSGVNCICYYCINTYLRRLSEESAPSESTSTADTTSDSEICDCDHSESRAASPQEALWHHMVDEYEQDNKQLLSKGKKWLNTYPHDPSAGAVIARLIDITPSAKLLHSAETWLTEFPNEDSAPILVATLLRHAPTSKLVRLANRYDLFLFKKKEISSVAQYFCVILIRRNLFVPKRSYIDVVPKEVHTAVYCK